MDFVPHTPQDIQEMLRQIGVASFDELLADLIPPEVSRCNYNLEQGLSEAEVLDLMKSKARLNASPEDVDCFLGAGAYRHFIPSIVGQLAFRGEFYTAYTPYQPEASQGTLQAIFEYQSMMARITGMEVSNASLYDGASALAEAALMAMAVAKDHGKILISKTVHPEYRRVVKTYLSSHSEDILEIDSRGGTLDPELLERHLKTGATAVLVQWPNFYGCLEDLAEISRLTHQYGALLIVSTYPVALGLLKSPGELGADICVGEGQSLGNALQFGGPYFGFIACRKEYVRKMPGRLVGMTKDLDGRRGYVLTLQAREQHIRREKATSNICTNQSLNALMATIHLAWLGPEGLKEMALLNVKKAHYAARELAGLPGCTLAFHEPFFNEFVLRVSVDPEQLVKKMSKEGILPGLPLGRFDQNLKDSLLICVTELMSREKIDRFSRMMKKMTSKGN